MLKGVNYGLQVSDYECRRRFITISADRQFQNTAPELALLYKLESRMAVPGARRHRLWHAAGRKPLRPFEWSKRQQHAAPDAAEPRLRYRVRLDAEQRAQIQCDRLLRVLPQRAGHPGDARSTRRMRASRSTRRGRSIAASSWPLTGSSIPAGASPRPIPISISSTPNIPKTIRSTGAADVFSFNRAGNKIPGHIAERTDGAARL